MAAVSAVAVAALNGSGPVPPQTPLAQALHDALTAPAPAGVSARITFTNHLFDSAGLQQTGEGPSNPLLSGASGRLWASADGHVRIELQGDSGDTEIMLAPGSARIYDTQSNTLYTATLPQHKDASSGAAHEPPSVQTIQSFLEKLGGHWDVSGAVPTNVAGQPAYAVTLAPKEGGSLLGGVQLIWDATYGAPLRVSIFAKGDTTPVLELAATDIDFNAPSASDLSVTPAPGTTVKSLDAATSARDDAPPATPPGLAGGVALTFLPNAAGGLPLSGQHTHGETTVATYGHGPGTVVVALRPARTTNSSSQSLPTVSLNTSEGTVTATEVVTPLGTVLTFEQGGDRYVVAGSVPQATAEAVAKSL
jgi:hypothetical protein